MKELFTAKTEKRDFGYGEDHDLAWKRFEGSQGGRFLWQLFAYSRTYIFDNILRHSLNRNDSGVRSTKGTTHSGPARCGKE